MEYYNISAEAAVKDLQSDVKSGLSAQDATIRLAKFGTNELKEKKKKSPLRLFFEQFRSFIIYILLFALAISILSNEYLDAVIILIILLLNAIIGFVQEYRAERSIEALRKLAGLKVKVVREGKVQIIDSKALVPGDVMIIEEGTKIAADARIIEAAHLAISEASLTGESVPVMKRADALAGELALADRKNMLYSGTTVSQGRAVAVVTATGMKTEIGKIAGMLTTVEEEMTPLQQKLESLGKKIGIATIAICTIIFVVGVVKSGIYLHLVDGNVLSFLKAANEDLLAAVSLAVAAVPEGLPAVVTIALAIGVKKMVHRNALIRRLPSVETLGEATVICSDKTGTLTRNEMTVRHAFVNGRTLTLGGEGYDLAGEITSQGAAYAKRDEQLFRIGVLCNDALLQEENGKVQIVGDPTEAALLISAQKAGMDWKAERSRWQRVEEEPFDSSRKMMSVVCKQGGTAYVFTKGAPERVLAICDRILVNGKVTKITAAHKKAIVAAQEEYAKNALRVLGFAFKEFKKGTKVEQKLIFVGLQGMIDPPHKEVPEAIARCHAAGIRVIMITGDNKLTAQAIAHEIGILGDAMEGDEFAALPPAQQKDLLSRINIFARVAPSHKMLIVDLLQQSGEVVAMTGDGVNDAPAIKKANLGIAMGISGTDVAKESSDMILQDDNFTSIVNAIEEGRGIYENIRKFVNYLLSCNFAEILVIVGAILLGLDIPMTAIMLLWLNLITDGLPALALSVDPHSSDIMQKPPKKAKEGIITKSLALHMLVVSVLIAGGVLGIFYWGQINPYHIGEKLEYMRTLAFTAIIVLEIVRLQAIRSDYKLSPFSNLYLVGAVVVSFLLQLIVLYTPMRFVFDTVALGFIDWVVILGVSIVIWIFSMLGTKTIDRFLH